MKLSLLCLLTTNIFSFDRDSMSERKYRREKHFQRLKQEAGRDEDGYGLISWLIVHA